MNHDEIIKAWNNQADKHNRWSDLGEDEMLEFAMCLEREACAATAEQVGQHKNHIGIAAAIRARGSDAS